MKRLHTIQDAILNIMEGSRGFKANQRRIDAIFKQSGGEVSVGTPEAKEIITRKAQQAALPVKTAGGAVLPAGRISRIPYVAKDGNPRKFVTGWEPREEIAQAHDPGIEVSRSSIQQRGKVGTEHTGPRGVGADQQAQKILLNPKTFIEPPGRSKSRPYSGARMQYTNIRDTPPSTPNPTAQLDTRISKRQAGAVQTGGRAAFPPAPPSPPTMMQRVGAAVSRFVKAG